MVHKPKCIFHLELWETSVGLQHLLSLCRSPFTLIQIGACATNSYTILDSAPNDFGDVNLPWKLSLFRTLSIIRFHNVCVPFITFVAVIRCLSVESVGKYNLTYSLHHFTICIHSHTTSQMTTFLIHTHTPLCCVWEVPVVLDATSIQHACVCLCERRKYVGFPMN